MKNNLKKSKNQSTTKPQQNQSLQLTEGELESIVGAKDIVDLLINAEEDFL